MKAEAIVCSDSHGWPEILPALEKAYPKADVLLHCGDLEDDACRYPHWIFVSGNNDWDPSMPSFRTLNIAGHRIFMTHSHLFSYFGRMERMAQKAKELNCDIVLYGHTHVGRIDRLHGIWLINPGSVRLPRDGKDRCYCKIEFLEDGSIFPKLIYEKDWPFQLPNPNSFWL